MKSTTQKTMLDMQANNSITFEDKETASFQIVKRDGSKVAYDAAILRSFLTNHLQGLNQDFIDLDIITGKVSSGMCNGKSPPTPPHTSSPRLPAPGLSSNSLIWLFCHE
jgi:hypothetical protein